MAMDSKQLAFECQQRSDREAQDDVGLLPIPPNGRPGLQDILGEVGEPFGSAHVMGYTMGPMEEVHEYCFKGKPLVPGDVGFTEMIATKLTYGRLLPGVTMTTKQARFLYARVVGNPILLERQAQRLGYTRACATAPGWLKLCELPEKEG